jgi:peptidoglycan-N-acetylglucosamine deacetylase
MSIAMTFDDGPNHTSTLKLLKLLESLRIPATFFVLGSMVKSNPATLKLVANSGLGHQIGNHSWSHRNFKTLTDAEIQTEISDTQKAIEETLSATQGTRIMRPPYGAVTPAQRMLITGMGFKVVLWNTDTNDWNKVVHKNAASIASFMLKNVKDGNIVLAHDIHDRTVEAMKIALPQLKAKFSFTTVAGLGV